MTWDFVPPPPPLAPRIVYVEVVIMNDDGDVDGDGNDGDIVSVEVVSKKGKLAKRRRIKAVLEGVKRDRGEVIRDTLDSAQL